MTLQAMAQALRAAGFAGVEAEGDTVFARLSASGAEFRADPQGAAWCLSLTWPLRASPAQQAGWNAAHPQAPMDLWLGETRVSMRLPPDPAALLACGPRAEAAPARLIRWRPAQPAPGPGSDGVLVGQRNEKVAVGQPDDAGLALEGGRVGIGLRRGKPVVRRLGHDFRAG